MYKVNWERTSRSQGYIIVYCPEHPKAWSTGYLYAHRVVMEIHLGRYLNDEEIVHHRDSNKQNNNADNLEILTQAEHGKEHHPKTQPLIIRCPYCGKDFQRRRNQRAEAKGYRLAFCSRSCNGKYYARARSETYITNRSYRFSLG
jgi:hypothetical protein